MLTRVTETDPVARRVGAVNTLVVRDGRWIGANTDVEGFLAPLAGRMSLKGTRAAVLGPAEPPGQSPSASCRRARR